MLIIKIKEVIYFIIENKRLKIYVIFYFTLKYFSMCIHVIYNNMINE